MDAAAVTQQQQEAEAQQKQQHAQHDDTQWLERYRVRSPLPDLFLVPEYVTKEEEERLTRSATAARGAWVQLSGRRLQNHGGAVGAKGYLVPAAMPAWLTPLLAQVGRDVPALAAANHVLLNAYQPGEGIMPHKDGPIYAPCVAILSLQSPCVIRFWREGGSGDGDGGDGGDGGDALASSSGGGEGGGGGSGGGGGRGRRTLATSLALPRRSLLVFAGPAYEECLHGIDEAAVERLDATVLNRGDFVAAAVSTTAAAAGGGGGGEGGESGGGGGGGKDPCLVRTGERLSLTIRRVLKVHRGLRLPGSKPT